MNGANTSAAEGLLITATLSGNCLESDAFKIGENSTKVESNLVFQTDKKSIKRMKTENFPIKIECYGLRGPFHYKLKEPIGHILISLRNIPVLPVAKAVQTVPRWYKVIGLSKPWRQHRPEFLMNIIITEKVSTNYYFF